MEKIIQLLKKYKSVIMYLIFGVLTTLVNIIAYWLCAHIIGLATMPSTVIAWALAVLFAYVTNRKWVFDSQSVKTAEIIVECAKFFLARLATGVVDWLCMFVFVDILMQNDIIVKIAANIIVIVLNYVASKLIIFKKKG